jgi:hypothetical protein
MDRIVGPPPNLEVLGNRAAKFMSIDGDGLACVGTEITPGSILVNKESPVNQLTIASGPHPTMPDEGVAVTISTAVLACDYCVCVAAVCAFCTELYVRAAS